MKVETLLQELVQNNVKLSVKEDRLLCQLPDGGKWIDHPNKDH